MTDNNIRINWTNLLWTICLFLPCIAVDAYLGTSGSWTTLPMYVLVGVGSAFVIGPVLEPKAMEPEDDQN